MTATDVLDRRSRQLAGIFPGTSVAVLGRDLRCVVVAGPALISDDSTGHAQVGLQASDMLPPDVWAALEPHCRAVLSGESTQWELAGGTDEATLRIRTVPMWNKDGDEVESIMVVVKDRSEKISASDTSRPSRVPAQRSMPAASPQAMSSRVGA